MAKLKGGTTIAGNVEISGDIKLTGTATTTNQARMIDFTGFDKEGTTDFSDRAYIQHTTNTGGHSGSVLVISSQNDTADGIAFSTNGNSQLKHNSNVIWDAGNDGPGSGLDADKLDNLEATQFLRSDAEDLYTPARLDFGSTGDWNSVGYGNQTNLHFRDHNQFWIGAGNGTWFTGTANTKSQASGLAADASAAHDLLITTMQSTSTYDRGITFAVDSNAGGTAGWRLGKWHSGTSATNSMLAVNGQIHAKGGHTDSTDYYADDYSTYHSTGNGAWPGDTNAGWHKPSIVAAKAIQIQSGTGSVNSAKPQLQFHQYGYGGPGIEYDGPNKTLNIGELGSSTANRLDYVNIKTVTNLQVNGNTVWHNGIFEPIVDNLDVLPTYTSSNEDFIKYNTTERAIEVQGTDDSFGAVYPALKTESGVSWKISFSIKASVSSTTGVYFRVQEYDGALPDGKTHIAHDASHSAVQEDTRQVTSFYENQGIGTSWEQHSFFYTPTSTTSWFSPLFLNWTGLGNNSLFIKNFRIFAIQEDSADANTLDGYDSSQFLRSDANDTASGNYTFTGYHTGNTQFYGTNTTGVYSSAPIEIREVNLVTTNQSSSAYAPGLAFHWGGRVQTQIKLHSDGNLNLSGNQTGRLLTTADEGSGNGLDADTLDTYHATDFVAVTGDTMTGNLTFSNDTTGVEFYGDNALKKVSGTGLVMTTDSTRGLDILLQFERGSGGTKYKAFHDGYHPNADKWTTARTLTLSGDASGSVSWDGSANATLSVTVANNSHTHSTVTDYAPYLYTRDNRTISPSEDSSYRLRYGFTSWNNNNTSPWADYLHMRSYADSSGGSDNLVMFKKSGIGMRIWQQSFGSSTAYSNYEDVWHSGNLTFTLNTSTQTLTITTS